MSIDLTQIILDLDSPDSEGREAARQSLRNLGDNTLLCLFEHCSSDDTAVRRATISAIDECHDRLPNAASHLISALTDSDEWVSYRACHALGKRPDEVTSTARRQLMEIFYESTSWNLRQVSLETLTSGGTVDEELIDVIATGLKDVERNVRYMALQAANHDKIWCDRIAFLVEAMQDDDDFLVKETASTIIRSRRQ